MPGLFDLSGRRALVTGAGTGLGRELVAGLAEASAELVLVGRRPEPLEAASRELASDGVKARAVSCDVTNERDRTKLLCTIGSIDILVNNAGRSDRQSWLGVRAADWEHVLALNLSAAFRLAQIFAPGMVERGFGRVVNIASLWASHAPDPARYTELPSMDVPAYGASKAGLLGLTRHLASILAPHGVTVNAISPGMFETELTRSLLTPHVRGQLEARTPVGRLGRPEDLRAAVVFLASEGAGFVTGIELIVDGGFALW